MGIILFFLSIKLVENKFYRTLKNVEHISV